VGRVRKVPGEQQETKEEGTLKKAQRGRGRRREKIHGEVVAREPGRKEESSARGGERITGGSTKRLKSRGGATSGAQARIRTSLR